MPFIGPLTFSRGPLAPLGQPLTPVLFNPLKNNLIVFNCATTEYIYLTFDGEKIQRTF